MNVVETPVDVPYSHSIFSDFDKFDSKKLPNKFQDLIFKVFRLGLSAIKSFAKKLDHLKIKLRNRFKTSQRATSISEITKTARPKTSNIPSKIALEGVFIFRGSKDFEGISIESFQALNNLAKKWFSENCIEACDGKDLNPSNWPTSRVLILPGGKCSEWEALISTKTQSEILSWLEKGGRIFGICAGSYFCSEKSRYKTVSENIDKVRTLNLFPGICQGPTFSPYLEVKKLRWEKTGKEGHVVVIGGGSFIPKDKSSEFEVLARYIDTPEKESIAVVKCKLKIGIAVLSAPHWEFEGEAVETAYQTFPQLFANYAELKLNLEQSKKFRQECLSFMKTELET